MKAFIEIATRLNSNSTTVCRPPGLPQFIVLSNIMTCIKCRLSSSIRFSDLRLLFNESLTSTALSTLQEYVRSWILCVPLCAELYAMVRKLTSLICFDIFQSKWYRNALIGVPKIVFAMKAFRCHFDRKMSKLIFLIEASSTIRYNIENFM